nr:MAG TPA: hypothetical protein [Caudoviricetes sp.]
MSFLRAIMLSITFRSKGTNVFQRYIQTTTHLTKL